MSVLVAYASKHGSTRGIAEAIAERLRARGIEVDVRPVERVDDIDGREAIVLGSAVYTGSWMKDATAFLERSRDALGRIPVWLFSSGPTGDQPTDVGVSDTQLSALLALAPRDHHLFHGALHPSDLGLLERAMAKAVKAPLGDFRDWAEIERWADHIADALAGGALRMEEAET